MVRPHVCAHARAVHCGGEEGLFEALVRSSSLANIQVKAASNISKCLCEASNPDDAVCVCVCVCVCACVCVYVCVFE